LGKINGITNISEHKDSSDVIVLTIEYDNSVDVRPEITRTIVKENLDLLCLKNTTMTLEEIFIKVTMN